MITIFIYKDGELVLDNDVVLDKTVAFQTLIDQLERLERVDEKVPVHLPK